MQGNPTRDSSLPNEGASPPKLRIALVGFGTVGRSVAKLLCKDTTGRLLLTHICNRTVERKKADWVPANVRWTENAAVAAALARHGINIDSVLQKLGYLHSNLPFVITLDPCSTSLVGAALEEIRGFDFHVQPPVWMPILR